MNDESTPAAVLLSSPGTSLELKLTGSFTSNDIPEVYQTAKDIVESDRDLLICCEQVDFLGTGVLQVLIALATSLGSRGRSLRFVGVQPKLERWLSLAGLA